MIERFLELVEAETSDGKTHRFCVGTDGVFVDVNDVKWYGSRMLSGGDREVALNGVAPAGELHFAYIQDPDGSDLQSQMMALGADYVLDQPIRFYHQALDLTSPIPVPDGAPRLNMTRKMKSLKISQSGVQNRSISVPFESAFENRRGAKNLTYTTTDHA
ncbi:MAG: hypothetical protein ABJP33_07720, partial [Pseudoruegeria sp.]